MQKNNNEHVTVTFQDTDHIDQKVNIVFDYNKDTQELNYNFEFGEKFDKESCNGLCKYLALRFLETLNNDAESTEENKQ